MEYKKASICTSLGGFTITELIMVVVIIGVLAAVAIPSYRIQMLKMQNQEAIRVLLAMGEAEIEYYRENGDWAPTKDRLAIEIPPMKNFTNVVRSATPITICGGSVLDARLHTDSLDSTYRLYLLEDGRVICRSAPGGCPGDLCKKMGFPAF